MVKSGMKATRITPTENSTGRDASATASAMTSYTDRSPVRSRNARWMCSRSITTASTKMPKSIAPTEIRFADWWVRTNHTNANRSDSGMAEAAMREIRQSPRNTNNRAVTSSNPEITTLRTVCVVRLMRSVRS